MAFFFTEKDCQKHKLLYGLAMILILFSLLATFARSAWIGFIVTFLLAAFLINKRLFVMNLAILLLLVVLVIFLNPDLQNRLFSIFDAGQNATRFNLWRTSVAMTLDNPWTGIGSGMYGDMYPYYKYPGFYDTISHSHNDHLQIAVISGFPGLAAWIAFWSAWFYYALKSTRKFQQAFDEHRMIIGTILSVTAILTAAFFQCYWLDLKNCIFIVFILLIGFNLFNPGRQLDPR
jgi:O-antigen ligase